MCLHRGWLAWKMNVIALDENSPVSVDNIIGSEL